MHIIILRVKFLVLNVEEVQTVTLKTVSKIASALVNTDSGVLQIINVFARLASMSHPSQQLKVVFLLTYKIVNLLSLNNVLPAPILMLMLNHALVIAFARTRLCVMAKEQLKVFIMKQQKNVFVVTLAVHKMTFVMQTAETNHSKLI